MQTIGARMTAANTLEGGRDAFARRAWRDACTLLSAAGREAALRPEDLERLAAAAYLIGDDAASADAWAGAHQGFLAAGDMERAALCAFRLAAILMDRGEIARGGGWLARARRVLDEGARDCAALGYLMLPDALASLGRGDDTAAYEGFGRAAEVGARFGDTDLVALARHGQGRALIRLGRVAEGVALLDEAMVAVTVGELSPMVAGDIYCSVLSACHEIFDLRRAQEWTAALSRWCEAQPDLVPYRGQCLVRRAELLQLHGAWPDAMQDAQRACERLSDTAGPAVAGAAFYQQGELHRLLGDYDAAAAAYALVAERGRSPQPGLAQLRLAQGEVAAAKSGISRALDEAADQRARLRLLSPYVEIMLEAGDVSAARAAADELSAIAGALDAPYLRAAAAECAGAVLLAEGDPGAAVAHLRRALAAWDEVGAPYEVGRAHGLIARACRALADTDGADAALTAARRLFERLGATPALRLLTGRSRRPTADASSRLTAREVEVLRLIATGRTNRAIAAALRISEKTVARHVSNIFTKLGVSSRAAATAYAYQHEVV